ncbi:glucans biosynthesis glucosyltransferase MdoH [Methylocystis heyeri]|uniref:Glucans biosynthesis glucosyltransferase H n=1 Tax=Methylocystis heyeri TaxID=391905 RepID=A0A6B8KFM5_9HYPH|nr:glucans biosynthesis glucosyltransferase MdoH [Methylocystis heyeri]QGM46409.1 glucans biosynthesis glucosyltransferase MdoH [Methylocystis heyeri]
MHGRIPSMTPTGLQSLTELRRRRLFVLCLNGLVYFALLFWLAASLGAGGWSFPRAGILAAFAIAAPWSVLGLCNAAIGFWLLHFHGDGLAVTAPFARSAEGRGWPRSRTAMLLTLRNEDPARAFARLGAMMESVAATGAADRFDWFVLSDTSDPRIAAQEETEFACWKSQARQDGVRLHYRRRIDNAGYKAGNIRDFCENRGAEFEFMIPLDADSLMDGETILRLVRMGEAHPRIGILQSLVVGAPSRSAFARIFQFGMRHGMRTYTMGATWWAGDCGPFWGHNALVRVAPFARHCVLPRLEGDRHILSHDQIEAALMRRAGFEVRALPLECGSYEENPPELLGFVMRDLRWCQGNMQYFKLLGLPGLLPTSRFQLVWAISMFMGAPAWTAVIALGASTVAFEDVSSIPAASLKAIYLTFLGFSLAPKIFGFGDVLLTPGGLARYGGAGKFFFGATVEIVSSLIIGAVTSLSETIFLLGLALGHTMGWPAQTRDAKGLKFRETAISLSPHFLFGCITLALSACFAPRLAIWSLPVTAGYIFAVPFALATAAPRIGKWFRRRALCATPEEILPPKILAPFL